MGAARGVERGLESEEPAPEATAVGTAAEGQEPAADLERGTERAPALAPDRGRAQARAPGHSRA